MVLKGRTTTFDAAGELKRQMVDLIRASATPTAAGFYPLSAMTSLSALPPIVSDCIPPIQASAIPEVSAFVALVLAVTGPDYSVDDEFWFTRTFLALVDPCSTAPDTASPSRLDDRDYEVPPSSSGPPRPPPRRLTPRSPWAWDLVSRYIRFAGLPTADIDGLRPGLLPSFSGQFLAAEFGPPWGPDFTDQETRAWSRRMGRTAAQLVDLARFPDRILSRLSEVPDGGEVEDRRVTLNTWGDFLLVRTVARK